ncbi:MAG: PEP-CTERM sorting domain-containing protein [Candidatus Korobacteraceae bacterium]|jgi:hypothetical protein
MKKLYLALLAMAVALAIAPAASADSWNFTISGDGITSSGTITATAAGGGVFDITGITGTFSDSSAGISSAAITGLEPSAYSSASPNDSVYVISNNTSVIGSGDWMYDNLLYPGGTAPAINLAPYGWPAGTYSTAGGLVDAWGILFDVAGGYDVNLFGNGAEQPYTVADFNASGTPTSLDDGTNVSFVVATPEPGSLLLLGTGLLGLAFVAFRKAKAAGQTLYS